MTYEEADEEIRNEYKTQQKPHKWCINPDCNAKFENIGFSHLSGDTRRSCDKCGVLWQACKACGKHSCQFTHIISYRKKGIINTAHLGWLPPVHDESIE